MHNPCSRRVSSCQWPFVILVVNADTIVIPGKMRVNVIMKGNTTCIVKTLFIVACVIPRGCFEHARRINADRVDEHLATELSSFSSVHNGSLEKDRTPPSQDCRTAWSCMGAICSSNGNVPCPTTCCGSATGFVTAAAVPRRLFKAVTCLCHQMLARSGTVWIILEQKVIHEERASLRFFWTWMEPTSSSFLV
jgi:hypothetical protein